MLWIFGILVSMSFLKTVKFSGNMSPFLTEGSNHDPDYVWVM